MKSAPTLLRIAVLVATGLPLSICDIRRRRLPDLLLLLLFAAGAAMAIGIDRIPPLEMVAALVLGVGIPVGARNVRRGGIGWGDIKLSGGLSLFVGWPGVLYALAFASLMAIAGDFLSSNRRDRKAGMVFGPYLVSGALVQMVGEFVT